MSSGFKNFFITFVICLLVFGFVGFKFVYPALSEALDMGEVINPNSDKSGTDPSEMSDPSGDESSQAPAADNTYDEKGDIFTLAVACVDSRGRAVASAFIDSNGKSKQFIICSVPTTVRLVNEAGVSVPLADMMPNLSENGMCSSFSALTGLPVEYSLKLTRSDLASLAAMVPGAYVRLSEDISFMDPKYKDFEPEPGEAYPDDYFITISNKGDRVLLNEKLNGRSNLEWLLEYNPNGEDSDVEYNAYYAAVAKAILRQFFEQKQALKNSSSLAAFIRGKQTNLTADAISTHLDTIFSNDEFRFSDIVYPGNWERAVETLRTLDGRKE